MITIICGTNRKGNLTQKFAINLHKTLQSKTDQPVKLLELEDFGHQIIAANMYEADGQAAQITAIQDEYIIPAEKLIFVMPEYNGSYPGIVKLFIDAVSIREYKPTFSGKKAGLMGIAGGRAGNLRGLDHLSDILNHMGTIVYPFKLPFSSVGGLLDSDGELTDSQTVEAIDGFADGFLKF